jgi:uncharacterized protein YjbI with pentapeptide repeats
MACCNELCTKEVLGRCALCEKLAERDRFERFWFKGGLFVDGIRALKRGRAFAYLHRYIWFMVQPQNRNKAPQDGYPVSHVEVRDKDVVREAHKQYSETLNRTMLALLGVALFCLLTTIGSPDKYLLVGDSTIKVPFAVVDTQMSFLGFIIVAPFLLILLAVYLHVFYGYWLAWERERQYINQRLIPPIESIPTLFSFPDAVPRRLTGFIFYWLVPLVLGVITWKAWAFPDKGRPLTYVSGVVTLALVLLQLRRRSHPQSTGWILLYCTPLFFVISFMVLVTFSPELFHRPLHLFRAALADAWLGGVDMRYASLDFADLQGAYLREANLQGANLQGANLRGANLFHAHLQEARLRGPFLGATQLQGAFLVAADLQGADLRDAPLQGAALLSANLQGADLRDAQLQGADLRGADLRGANLLGTQLQGAHLATANLQGATLMAADLQGAFLDSADLRGADLRGANIGSADCRGAHLTWSDLRGLRQAPLDKTTSESLEIVLTDALSDTGARNSTILTVILRRLHAAVERPTNLSAADANEHSVLCDDVTMFRFCVTPEQIAGYADGRLKFLVKLACQDAAIARGLILSVERDHSGRAFAQHFTTSREKDCPGWAALSADKKDFLRKLAAGENPVPK